MLGARPLVRPGQGRAGCPLRQRGLRPADGTTITLAGGLSELRPNGELHEAWGGERDRIFGEIDRASHRVKVTLIDCLWLSPTQLLRQPAAARWRSPAAGRDPHHLRPTRRRARPEAARRDRWHARPATTQGRDHAPRRRRRPAGVTAFPVMHWEKVGAARSCLAFPTSTRWRSPTGLRWTAYSAWSTSWSGCWIPQKYADNLVHREYLARLRHNRDVTVVFWPR